MQGFYQHIWCLCANERRESFPSGKRCFPAGHMAEHSWTSVSPLGHAPFCRKQTAQLCMVALDVQAWSSGEHLGLGRSYSAWDIYLDAVWESSSPAKVGKKDQVGGEPFLFRARAFLLFLQARPYCFPARLRSFTKAAEQFYITQTAMTQQIRALEETVGATLFDRSTRPVSLTPAGAAFLLDARAILERMDVSLERIKEASTGLGGTLRIG